MSVLPLNLFGANQIWLFEKESDTDGSGVFDHGNV
jgi:hypothetical protein